jgi:hypothetical protein
LGDKPSDPAGLSDEWDSEEEPDLTTPRQQRSEKRTLGPAGNRKGHVAADTVTFFDIKGDKKICQFCL